MSTLSTVIETIKFNRDRTLKTLSTVDAEPNPRSVLAWRPGPGRAHIGWQLMHIGITEELFASDRLGKPKPPAYAEYFARFKGGSTPDDDVPTPDFIRRVLGETRERLLATLGQLDENGLDVIPDGLLKERGWSLRTALQVIAWHEPHHQGQAHITYNLYKAATK
ncbi:MAG TPA: DinB family protein [Pirellulales bacterium]|nr:DinB family protein [Pirellulales bacterium]